MDDIRTLHPPYRLAALVALGTLALYVATLSPTTQFWDTSEYATAAYVLGIAHPPGNPLFVLIAHAWGLIPFARDYAERLNLLAALASAAAAGLWFLIGERWLRPIVSAEGPRRLVALAGAVVGATAFTVWNQSVVNEKVYTISLFSVALALWLALRWADRPAEQRRDRDLALIVYLLALTATNHLMGLLVVPAVLVYVVTTDPGALLRPRFLVAALLVAAVGTSVNLFLPIRAHLFPILNEGEPTTWAALKAVLSREQFGKPSVFDNPMYPPGPENPGHTLTLYGQQLLNYVQYFAWQWGHDWGQRFEAGLAAIFGCLGLLGARSHWRFDRRAALAMTALLVTLTLLLVFYLNFKWGFSQAYRNPPLPHEVRERDYFFIVSFSAWGVWVSMGLATLLAWVEEALEPQVATPRRRWVLAAPVLLLALLPLVGNRLTASRAGETMARDYARDVLRSLDPSAIVVTAGDNDTFPLWYARDVEGVRPDVSILVLSLANTDWYLRQLQRPPRGPWMQGYYTGVASDTLPIAVELAKPVSGTVGPIPITVDPQSIGHPYLERSDLAVLQIIKDRLGRRPIYFSGSTGRYADALGLTPYLVGEGLVRRLEPRPVTPGDSIVAVQGLGYVNVVRTKALAFGVYRGGVTAARRRPRGWVDLASQNSLLPYALIYDTLAAALTAREPETAARALALRDAILVNVADVVAARRPGE